MTKKIVEIASKYVNINIIEKDLFAASEDLEKLESAIEALNEDLGIKIPNDVAKALKTLIDFSHSSQKELRKLSVETRNKLSELE